MSAIVGERDKLLQAANARNLTPRQGKDLQLSVDPTSFHLTADGVATPLFATFTAHKIGLDGVDNWVASNGATLSGTGLTRRLDFANMPGATTTVTLTTVEDGQIYTAKASIGRVQDGATGSDADVTPENLLTALESRITKSQLFADLKSEIDLITDPVTVTGSVQQRVLAEANARVDAILAESNARTNYVQTWAYNKQTIDSTFTSFGSAIQASYQTYANNARDQAVATANADVRSYGYSVAQADYAISVQVNQLRSEFVSSGGATEGYVQAWSYSKSQQDQTELAQFNTLTANYTSFATSKRDEAVTSANAYTNSATYARTTIDQAFTSQSNTLTANYTSYANQQRDNAIAAAAADVRNYTLATATINNAIAQSTSQVSARLDNIGGATLEQKFTAQASLNTGLSTQYTLKSDINGYITGFGFASSANNGNPTSAFIINAGAFAVVAPGAAPTVMFSVSNGTVGFSGELKGPSGTFGALKLTPGGYIQTPNHNGTYAWPTDGSSGGFFLSETGLLLGNALAGGAYAEFDANGFMDNPGFRMETSGVMTFKQKNIVTNNIVDGAITGFDYFPVVDGAGGNSIFVVNYPSQVLIDADLAPYTGSGTWGYDIKRFVGFWQDYVTVQSGRYPTNLPAGTYRVETRDPSNAPVLNMLIDKRAK